VNQAQTMVYAHDFRYRFHEFWWYPGSLHPKEDQGCGCTRLEVPWRSNESGRPFPMGATLTEYPQDELRALVTHSFEE
jgi:hypothetical protein